MAEKHPVLINPLKDGAGDTPEDSRCNAELPVHPTPYVHPKTEFSKKQIKRS